MYLVFCNEKYVKMGFYVFHVFQVLQLLDSLKHENLHGRQYCFGGTFDEVQAMINIFCMEDMMRHSIARMPIFKFKEADFYDRLKELAEPGKCYHPAGF